MSGVITQETIEKLFELKREKKLEHLPPGFKTESRKYLQDLHRLPDNVWERKEKEEKIEEVGFKIRYILEGFDQ